MDPAIETFEAEARELVEAIRALRILPARMKRRLAAFLIARLAERLLLG